MKKITCIACISIFLLTGCDDKDNKNTFAAHDSNVLFVGINPFRRPFSFYKNNRLVGIDVDIVEAIGKHLGKEIKYVEVKTQIAIQILRHKYIDMAMSSVVITETRRKYYDLSVSYHTSALGVLSRVKDPINSNKDMLNKRIGCFVPSIMEIVLRRYIRNARVVAVSKELPTLIALRNGTIDGWIIGLDEGQKKAQEYKELQCQKLKAKSEIGIGIVLRKNSPLTPEVNKVLTILKNDGTIKAIEDKWYK